MKRTRLTRLLLMGVVPVALTACEGERQVQLYANVQECVAAGQLPAEQCNTDFAAAQNEHERVAPRYQNQIDCTADFGSGQCVQQPSGSFMPLLMGYMIGSAMTGGRQYSQPVYRDRSGEFRNAGGADLGKSKGQISVPESATQPQARAITMARSGFGSRASARGSWGGG